jgi:hypothetical protein
MVTLWIDLVKVIHHIVEVQSFKPPNALGYILNNYSENGMFGIISSCWLTQKLFLNLQKPQRAVLYKRYERAEAEDEIALEEAHSEGKGG